MSVLEAIILGIIQGLSEFLPISSSGHLELAKGFFSNDTLPQESMLMTVVLHAGTALSTIVIFRKDILDILKGLLQFKSNEELSFSLKIMLSMVPAVFVGVLLDEQIEQFFNDQILLVGGMLLITGLLLFLAEKSKSTTKSVNYINAIIVGIAQAIAILPGISRSGATISTCVLLGIDKEKAARFSFLMVVPLIIGKVSKDLLDEETFSVVADYTPLTIGFIVSFVVGLVACQWMIKIVKNAKLFYFAYYCFAVGIIAIISQFI